jgi:hypothetical protein
MAEESIDEKVASIEQDYRHPEQFRVQFHAEEIERHFDMDRFIQRVARVLDEEVTAANLRSWDEEEGP